MKIIDKKKATKGICIILLMVGFVTFPSCDKDFGDINDSYDAKLYEANVQGLFNGLVASLPKERTRHRIPMMFLYSWTQQAAQYSLGAARMDMTIHYAWNNYYQAKTNIHDIENLIAAEENPENYTNILAMAKVIMAYKTLTTTLLYGDMPYSEAGKGFLDTELFRPVYDGQQSIMESAIDDLSWAVNNISTSGNQVSLGSYDVLLMNDIDAWVAFANSLRLRYAMVMREVNASFADPIIADALNKPLLAPEELVSLNPATIPNFEIEREWYWRSNAYIRCGSTMFDAMSETDAVDGSGIFDLRCPILFEYNMDDEWVVYPQVPGNDEETVIGDPYMAARLTDWDSNRSNYASVNLYFVNDVTLPQFIITGSQISFLKAEIYNRGLAGVSADAGMAETNYLEGITASVNFWQKHAYNSIWEVNAPETEAPTPEDLNAMLTNPEVVYSSDAADALSQIYKQSWIAMFHQPFEAWNLQRRTDNATPFEPLSSTSLVVDFHRLIYPAEEKDTNRENWFAATNGNDSRHTKIWIQP